MLSEYANMTLMCSLTVLLFLGGYLGGPLFFGFKVALLVYTFIWLRATLPRYRYFDLMQLGWKSLLPFAIAFVILVPAIFVSFDWI
jgi:NADH-quinone oxidoreductase subunit H